MQIVTSDQPVPEAEAVLKDGLQAYNLDQAGYNDRQPLSVLVHIDGAPVGGAIGRTSLGVLFLDQFFLPDTLRGQGLGIEVLRRFEAEGRRRGCAHAVVHTISFQAPRFYERQGWTRFGEIPSSPPGTSRIWLRKTL